MTIALTVTPSRPLLDDVLHIEVAGLQPNQPVVLDAAMVDHAGRSWTSTASFVSDTLGGVNPALLAPVTGSYSGIDPMGLFWSMTVTDAEHVAGFALNQLEPVQTTLRATTNEGAVSTVAFERTVVAPYVTRQSIRDDGLVATLFVPDTHPAPAVLVVGGSAGGLSEYTAALLAAHGFSTLTLAYFGVEHLPTELVQIPLEYFATALAWVQRMVPGRPQRVGVLGTSRGGELALLVGATFPTVAAVVGVAPSGVLYRGVSRDRSGPSRAAWSYHGQPLPFKPRLAAGAPVDAEQLAAATIPVEQIQGPILLISGADDQVWPAAELAAIAMDRRARAGHADADQHICYPGAGHIIRPPFQPTTYPPYVHPVSRRESRVGGTPVGNAYADADSWDRIIAFFRTHLV